MRPALGGCGGCGARVRWVAVDGVSVALEPQPSPLGDIAARNIAPALYGYRLSAVQRPARGYRRYRRHVCPVDATAT